MNKVSSIIIHSLRAFILCFLTYLLCLCVEYPVMLIFNQNYGDINLSDFGVLIGWGIYLGLFLFAPYNTLFLLFLYLTGVSKKVLNNIWCTVIESMILTYTYKLITYVIDSITKKCPNSRIFFKQMGPNTDSMFAPLRWWFDYKGALLITFFVLFFVILVIKLIISKNISKGAFHR